MKWRRISALMPAVVLLVPGLLLPVVTAYAAWSGDPTVNTPICTADGDQVYPELISDGAGGAIITWTDERSGNGDIYAQRVDASGNALWEIDGIAVCTAPELQNRPRLVADGSGGAIITWYDSRNGAPDIYAQRVDASGNTLWKADGVAVCTAFHYQTHPQIVFDGLGSAVVAWHDYRNRNFDIYAQRLDDSGNTMWTTNGVAVCTATGNQTGVKLVSDGSGGAIITWPDERNSAQDIYAQRLDASGSAMWTTDGIAVCTTTGDQFYPKPKIVSDSSGGAIITWWDRRGGNSHIYAQLLDASGNTLWTDNGTAIDQDNSGSGPELISDDAGGAIITFQGPGNNTDIYVQRVDASGNTTWAGGWIAVCAAVDHQHYKKIVSDGAGGAIITWEDERSDEGDVYAQRVNSSGNVMWKTDGIPVSTAADTQMWSQLASDGSGGAIITWDDDRFGDDDIYAQRIDANGLLAPPTTPQLWYLDSETTPAGYEMKKSSGNGDDCQTGSVNIGSGNSAIWLADQAAICDVAFPGGSWVAEIRTDSDWGTEGDKCEVAVGGWDTDTGWYEIPTMKATTVTWDCDFNILTVLLQTDSGTVYQDDYLALNITNEDSVSHKVYTNGRSSLWSPDTDPGYPVPELASGILFGLGMAGLLGYLRLKKRTAMSV